MGCVSRDCLNRLTVLLLLWAGMAGILTVHAEDSDVYTLDRGDKIRINVFREANLSMDTRLGDEGKLSYPFLGEVSARGLTTSQLEKVLEDGLRGRFLVNPKVNISMIEYRPFFVHGEVNKPGGYPYQPGMTLIKALVIAGGITLRGSDKRIDIKHANDPAAETSRISMDELIQPGDIITVGQRVF